MSKIRGTKRFLAVAFSLLLSHPVLACDLIIHAGPEKMPDGRINAIALNLSHGYVSALRQIPFGWHFVVMDDPSWITWVTGQSIVGATNIDRDELSSLFSITPEPGLRCAELVKNGDLSIVLTVYIYDGDKLKKYRVSRSAIELHD